MKLNNSPIFIVGTPRSGTTLLAAMLGSHSRLDCGPETHFFRYLRSVKEEDIVADGRWPGPALDLIERMELHGQKVYKNFGLHLKEIEKFLVAQKPSVRAVLESLTLLRARKMGKERWVEKTPNHLLFLPKIREHFPQSPIIRIVRDLRDAALSMRKLPWASNLILPNLLLLKEWEKRGANEENSVRRVMVIRYEDLVDDPQSILGRVCRFIGEEFEPQMLVPGKNARKLIGEGEWWKEQVTGQLDRSRCYVWRREMPKEHARAATLLASEELKRYGYSVDEEPARKIALFPPNPSIIEAYEAAFLRLGSNGIGIRVCLSFTDLIKETLNPKTFGILVIGFPEGAGHRDEITPLRQAIRLILLSTSFLLCRIKGKKLIWLRDVTDAKHRYTKAKSICEMVFRALLRVKREQSVDVLG